MLKRVTQADRRGKQSRMQTDEEKQANEEEKLR